HLARGLGIPPLVRVEERPGTEAPGEEEHEESQPTEARERAGKGLVYACGLHPQRVTREGSSLSSSSLPREAGAGHGRMCAAEAGRATIHRRPEGRKGEKRERTRGPIGAASFPQACRSPA